MKSVFTSVIAVLFVAGISISTNAFSQCSTTGSITTTDTYNFASSSQGFTGDFAYNNQGGGQLESTLVSAGTTKVLTSPTFFAPNNLTTLQFGFDLAGNANVTAYSIDVRYFSGGTFQTVNLCTSTTALSNGTYKYSFAAPSQIIGKNFQIRITFTVGGSGSNTKTIDNFIVNVGGANIVLPVKFSSFYAKASNSAVSLNWELAIEENIVAYEVEKSTDSRSFSKIGSVNATATKAYSFTDNSVVAGTSFYRIKSVDVHGQTAYSVIVSLKNGKSAIVFKAFPTLTQGVLTLQHDAANELATISIASADGKAVRTMVPAKATQQTILDLSSFQSGVYFIRYKNGNNIETVKIIKQ